LCVNFLDYYVKVFRDRTENDNRNQAGGKLQKQKHSLQCNKK
jgi:hypothetical protein